MLAHTLQTDRQTDRQTDNDTKSQRISQTIIAGFKKRPVETNIAQTLLARDYKGVANQGSNLVVVKKSEEK